jgi:hypothetical protein
LFDSSLLCPLFHYFYAFRGRDEPETHYNAIGVLRWLILGDSSRPIALAPTSPNSGLETRHRHYE